MKINKESQNLIEQNFKYIEENFPQCITEGKIDFEKLKNSLGEFTQDKEERYTFSWSGQKDALKAAQITSKGTLIPDKDESVNFDDTQNIFIEGDNLEVLKLLQKSYFGKIKMIYIDPPYNTGNDFVYKDDFKNSIDSYLEQTGQKKDGIKQTTNPETSGRFHSDWMSMMYPRLSLAYNLLRDDGVIFVSIDDNEVHNLRIMMNEIFGEENFITCFIWEGGLKNDSKFVSISHDYIICFTKNKLKLNDDHTIWRLRKDGIDKIYTYVEKLKKTELNHDEISNELKKWYGQLEKTDPSFGHKHYNEIDERGIFFPGDISWPGGGGPRYEILHPITKRSVKIPSRGWIYAKKETMLEEIKKNKIRFGKTENTIPNVKRYLHETEGQVINSVFYKDRRNSKKKLKKLMGEDVFENPKEPDIIQKLVKLISSNSDIILDFFVGSGTMCESTLLQNVEDHQHRKFICVQLPELCKKDSAAYNSGFKTIADISKERIRRVIKQIKEENKQQKIDSSKQDLGFKVFKLAKSNHRIWEDYTGKDPEELKKQTELFSKPLIDGYEDIDVIYEVIIKEGYSLNSEIQKLDIKSNTIYKITDQDSLFYITLDAKINDDVISELDLKKDTMFVCIDDALDDSKKTNLSLLCNLKTI